MCLSWWSFRQLSGDINPFNSWLGCRKLVSTERPVPLVEGVIDRSGVSKFWIERGSQVPPSCTAWIGATSQGKAERAGLDCTAGEAIGGGERAGNHLPQPTRHGAGLREIPRRRARSAAGSFRAGATAEPRPVVDFRRVARVSKRRHGLPQHRTSRARRKLSSSKGIATPRERSPYSGRQRPSRPASTPPPRR